MHTFPHEGRPAAGMPSLRGLSLPGLAALIFLLVPTPALSGLATPGLRMPPSVAVAGSALRLNGEGLRKKLFIKIYAIGLYLEDASDDAADIVAMDRPKALRLELLLPLDGETIARGIARGFARSSSDRLPLLQERLDQLSTLLPDVSRGDEILLEWVPDRGTVVRTRGKERGVIPGKDFADALFAVWLGDPVGDPRLKARLLGGF